MSSITELLSKKKSEISRPPVAPIGHYRFKVYKAYTFRESGDGAWSFLDIPVEAIAPQVDVDEEELAEWARPISSLRLNHTFIFTNDPDNQRSNDDTRWQLQEFLNQLGVEADEDEDQYTQLSRVIGLEFIGSLNHQVDKRNPDITRPRIVKTIGLGEYPEYV